jgi:hypothetical protein
VRFQGPHPLGAAEVADAPELRIGSAERAKRRDAIPTLSPAGRLSGAGAAAGLDRDGVGAVPPEPERPNPERENYSNRSGDG